MKWFRSGVVCALILCLPAGLAQALDQSRQQVIDAFRAKFDIYIGALQELQAALSTARSETDVVRAADRFCDSANRFVDEFNATREYYRDTEQLKSLTTDPEARKAVEDFVNGVQKHIEDAQPTFDNLIRQITKYQKNSTSIQRVRDRVAATCQRVQLINF
jgi:lysyl-tRNA synthetase class I